MERSIRVCLLTEDTYAPAAIEELIKKLGDAGLIGRRVDVIKREHTYGKYEPCNPKLGRIIKAIADKCDRILVFVDADGGDVELTRKERVDSHVDKAYKAKVKVVVFQQEIEELIDNFHISQRPSDSLRRRIGYHKRELKKYIDELDLKDEGTLKRLGNLQSFKDLISFLSD